MRVCTVGYSLSQWFGNLVEAIASITVYIADRHPSHILETETDPCLNNQLPPNS